MARENENTIRSDPAAEHLSARPAPEPKPAHMPAGFQSLGPEGGRRTLFYVPMTYDPSQPTPIMVFLHGAGGDAEHALPAFIPEAQRQGVILLAPSSARSTWDVILADYGPDVATIDQALRHVFERYAVDPRRIAVAGFSDGASYALSLGIINGALFTHIVAFSPGFMVPTRQQGAPKVFISHGVSDSVLPIARCSRRIVPALKRGGYDVRYQEFPDGHTIPTTIAQDAFGWFVGAPR